MIIKLFCTFHGFILIFRVMTDIFVFMSSKLGPDVRNVRIYRWHFVPQMAFLVTQHCSFQCLGIWGVYLILSFLNNFILFIYFGSVGVHCCTGFLSLWRAGVPLWLQYSSSLLRG